MDSIPPHVRTVLDALKFTGARRADLRTMTDSEWKDILSHWGWVRLTLPLRQVCGDDLPIWVRAQIDETIADNTERLARIKKDYLEIINALRDAGVEHLLLKGFAQWPAYMQSPRVRSQSDIDIFCPPESAFRGRDAICSLGYRWLHPIRKPKFSDHLPPLEKQNHWQWRGKHFDPDIPASVEVHYQFWNEADTRLRPTGLEHFWFRRVERQVDDFTCPALDDVDSLAYSALHTLRNLLATGVLPYHVYEIAWFLHTHADNEAFWKKREELHHDSLRSLEAVCFKLAKDWFACCLPDQVEKETRSLARGVHNWFQRYADSPLTALLRPNKDALWLHLSLLESSSDKRSILWRRLLPMPLPAEPVKRWTPRTYARFLIQAISRVPYHSRLLPRMLWHGFRWWWSTKNLGRRFWIFYAASFFFDLGMFVFFFLYNLYLLDCGYTEKFIGQVTSANAVGSIVGTIPAGMMAQRYGLQRTMVTCFALTSLVSALLAVFVSEVPQLCLSFLAGAVATIFAVCISPALAQLTDERNRPFGFSIVFSFGIGEGIIGSLVGGHLPGWLARFGPTAAPAHLKQTALLIACGIVALAIWPTSLLRFIPTPAPERKSYRCNPFLLRFLPAIAVWSLATGAFSPFANVYFSQHLRMPVPRISAVFSASQLSQMLAIIAAPMIFKKFGLVVGIAYTQIAAALALGCLAVVPGATAAACVYVGFMAFQWMSEPGMYSVLMNQVAPSERSSASALNFLVISLAQAIAAVAAGASFARFGYPAVLSLTALVALLAAILFRLLLGNSTTQPITSRILDADLG